MAVEDCVEDTRGAVLTIMMMMKMRWAVMLS